MEPHRILRRRRLLFLCTLSLLLLPLFFFPIVSGAYQQLYHLPAVSDGAIDLQQNADALRHGIPLNGDWTYFSGSWIVSDPPPAQSDGLTRVPVLKSRRLSDRPVPELPRTASYRLRLENCPGGLEITCFVPNLGAHYRVFLNGELVTQSGDMHSTRRSSFYEAQRNAVAPGREVPAGGDAELVIELFSPLEDGLYLTPILAERRSTYRQYDWRAMTGAALVGVLAAAIGCIAAFFFMHDTSIASLALLLMDLMALLRVLFFNGLPTPFGADVLTFGNYCNTLLLLVTLFLPVLFLHCARELVQLRVSTLEIRRIVGYELLFCLPLLWCGLTGRPRLLFLFCLLSYLPFVYVIHKLYRSLRQAVPYTLTVCAIIALIISSTVSLTLISSGLLVQDVALFPSASFALAMLLQLWMFISRNIQLQKQAVEAGELRLRLAQSETAVMLSQIKPHFLYNSLIAIQVLCTEEPETAAETVRNFALFLRTNMNFINSVEPIPFEQELSHIRNYANIEQLRFQKRLTMRYEIGATDFRVPALSIQPLVENAIRHGACKNIGGGTVLLRTMEQEQSFLVEITDDGPGFDTRPTDGQSHGIANVTFRLREQIHADVAYESLSGRGTTVRITIPKEGQHESDTLG